MGPTGECPHSEGFWGKGRDGSLTKSYSQKKKGPSPILLFQKKEYKEKGRNCVSKEETLSGCRRSPLKRPFLGEDRGSRKKKDRECP